LDWTSKKVLVTGAGGFIGSHLAEGLLGLGAQVRALVRYNSTGSRGWLDMSEVGGEMEIVAGDVCDRDCVRKITEGVDIVFHLAALIGIPYSYHAPASYVRTNVEGTLNILQGALDAKAELVVHASTSEVYGTARYVPIDENHPLQAQSPYSASKIAADKLAEAYYRSFDLPVVTLRPFNTYGPRQSARAIIPTIITQCLAGKEVVLGSLHPTRDFCYVSDTVAGFIKAAEATDAAGKTIHLGTGSEISMEDLAKKIISLTGKKVSISSNPERVRPEKSEVERLCATNELAKDLLGWKPVCSLDDGLGSTIEWMKKNLEYYRRDSYVI
jgi:dTDP-glucose 4,6-dehydratase